MILAYLTRAATAALDQAHPGRERGGGVRVVLPAS